MARPKDTRFTPAIVERMTAMRYAERRSCEYIAKHLPFKTTARQVSNHLCNSGYVWDSKSLRVPSVTRWDFRGMDVC